MKYEREYMKNNLNELNNYLFEELERLNDDEELKTNMDNEIKRAKAITSISTAIINNARVILEAKKYADEYGIENENQILKLSDGNEKVD